MADKKRKMAEISDIFIAFPGDIDNNENIYYILNKIKNFNFNKPLIIFNINNYYDHIFYNIKCNNIKDKLKNHVFFVRSINELVNLPIWKLLRK